MSAKQTRCLFDFESKMVFQTTKMLWFGYVFFSFDRVFHFSSRWCSSSGADAQFAALGVAQRVQAQQKKRELAKETVAKCPELSCKEERTCLELSSFLCFYGYFYFLLSKPKPF